MTRLSAYLLPTEKEPPADAEALSHQLMVRAGLVRQLGAGMWTWLPAGWRGHRRIEQIVREEMDAIGGQGMLMAVPQPEEVWGPTGPPGGPGPFRLRGPNGPPALAAVRHRGGVP